MASIVFKDLEKPKLFQDSDGYTYKDVTLDITRMLASNDQFSSSPAVMKDIQVSYDEEAIRNSLVNIFNTIPGERFLLPTFGCNLLAYLFQPMFEATATAIANTIYQAVKNWEPRVQIDNVNVVGNPDTHEYFVDVRITIPILKRRSVKFVGILGAGGFREIRTAA